MEQYWNCLFIPQVTDNELQAITQQVPDDEQQILDLDHVDQSETVYVLEDSIEDREELIEESQVCKKHFHWLLYWYIKFHWLVNVKMQLHWYLHVTRNCFGSHM